MTVNRVAIKLETEGKATMVRDFADVGAAGDAAANRAAKSFARAADDYESSQRRMAAAAQKFTALGVGGASGFSVGAPANMPPTAAFREFIVEQQRFQQVATRTTASAGQQRAGMQQLGFQFQDLGVQMAQAAGSSNVFKGVMTGLAMQGPQVVSAIALMRGSAGGFIGFLAGPWGAAIMAATSVLAVLGAEFLGSGKKAKKAAEDVDEYAASINRLIAARGRFSAEELGQKRKELLQLEGWRRNPQFDPEAPQGGNRAGDIARAIRRQELDTEIAKRRADYTGLEMGYNNNLKMQALGAQDKANAKAARAAQSAAARSARSAASEAKREEEAAAREALQRQIAINSAMNDAARDVGKTATEALEKEGKQLEEISKFMAEQRADTAAGTVLLNLEYEMRGKSRQEIESALELRRYQLDIEKQFPALTREQVDDLVEAKKAQIAWGDSVGKTFEAIEQRRRIGEQAIDRLFDIRSAESWGDRVKGILSDIVYEMWKMAALNPLKNMLFNSGLPTAGGGGGGGGGLFGSLLGGIGGLFGGGGGGGGASSFVGGGGQGLPSIDQILKGGWSFDPVNYAVGTTYASGGMAWVGENGPELVGMPRGAKVMTAGDSKRMASNDNRAVTYAPVYNIDATGADPAAITRLEQALDRLDRNVEARSIAAVQDAKDRLILR